MLLKNRPMSGDYCRAYYRKEQRTIKGLAIKYKNRGRHILILGTDNKLYHCLGETARYIPEIALVVREEREWFKETRGLLFR